MASKTVRGADGSAYTLFFTAGSYFSNFYPCDRLHIDGQDFLCSEQFFMYRKAVTFGDNDSAKKILCATIPGEMKSLGRKVSPFDDKVWKKASLDAMITANVHKFKQNEYLRTALLETADSTLVECSPWDRIWGIGLSMNNGNAANPAKWRGQNLLGKILTEIRDCLIDSPDSDADDVIDAVKKRIP